VDEINIEFGRRAVLEVIFNTFFPKRLELEELELSLQIKINFYVHF
jgi:hypothetical protein